VPRVIVTIDQGEQRAAVEPVLLDERVDSLHLDDDHAATQFVERLGWAISDAESLERAGSDAWSS
jgi:hypothetical protein